MTADCRDKDIKKQFRSQNAFGDMLVRKFSLWQKSSCSRHIVTPFMDELFGVIHSRTLLENLLSVLVTHSINRLINVPRYTSSSLAFAMNVTDHINVVFRKFTYSLMSRVLASPNSIVTAIVNSDAYHQSPLMDKWESMLYV